MGLSSAGRYFHTWPFFLSCTIISVLSFLYKGKFRLRKAPVVGDNA